MRILPSPYDFQGMRDDRKELRVGAVASTLPFSSLSPSVVRRRVRITSALLLSSTHPSSPQTGFVAADVVLQLQATHSHPENPYPPASHSKCSDQTGHWRKKIVVFWKYTWTQTSRSPRHASSTALAGGWLSAAQHPYRTPSELVQAR